MAYSFHKYWNANNTASIQGYLNMRSTYNVPLWLGETGENSNAWFTDCVNLMQQNDIGWSWWTLKKFSTTNAPLNVPITTEYQTLLNYWGGTGTKPSVSFATNALLRMADNLKFESCVFQNDMIDAMMRQPYDNSIIPFASNDIPGIIYFDNYDLGKVGYAYNDADYQNAGGSQTSWNSGGSYRNDGVDIEQCSDFPSNGYDVGWINGGEWLKFTVNVATTGTYNVDFRYAANQTGGKLVMNLDGLLISPYPYITIPTSGGWQSWQTLTVPNIQMTAGKHILQIQFLSSGYNLNYMLFSAVTGTGSNKVKEFNFKLNQNYPNPFNHSTKISYSVPKRGFVSLRIFNILGSEITKLVNETQNAGEYTVNFDSGKLPAGIYVYSLTNGTNTAIKKMILLK
jgi:hypothetical protein